MMLLFVVVALHLLAVEAAPPPGNDLIPKKDCKRWKDAGYCSHTSRYFPFMFKQCLKTCDFCPFTVFPSPTIAPVSYPNCKDRLPDCSKNADKCGDPSQYKGLSYFCKKTCHYCETLEQPGCGRRVVAKSRIVGGSKAKPGQWPWIVTFDYAKNTHHKGHYCGGTLITDEWILSAAHCFRRDMNVSQYTLKLGEHDLGKQSGHEQSIAIAEIILHPEYDSDNHDSDIALVRLSRKAKLNNYVRAACLPRPTEHFPAGTDCYVAGWGYLTPNTRGPQVLHQAKVPLVDRLSCMASDPFGRFTDNMICAGYKEGRVDSCKGDSGGPLICKTNGAWFLWGIVSWGDGCALPDSYGYYTKTTMFVSWIEATIAKGNLRS